VRIRTDSTLATTILSYLVVNVPAIRPCTAATINSSDMHQLTAWLMLLLQRWVLQAWSAVAHRTDRWTKAQTDGVGTELLFTTFRNGCRWQ